MTRNTVRCDIVEVTRERMLLNCLGGQLEPAFCMEIRRDELLGKVPAEDTALARAKALRSAVGSGEASEGVVVVLSPFGIKLAGARLAYMQIILDELVAELRGTGAVEAKEHLAFAQEVIRKNSCWLWEQERSINFSS